MPRNRRSPGLIRSTARTAARTAVIAGTATATSNAVHDRMNRGGSAPTQQAVMAMPPPVSPPVPTPAPTAEATAEATDFVAQLAQLAQLRDVGALTEEEFQQAKAQILAQGVPS